MSRLLLMAFLIYSSLPLLKAEEIFVLEKIEVIANKDISKFNFSQSQHLSLPEMEQGKSGTLASKLEDISGVIGAQNGGPGGRVSFFIRGTEPRHVAFTIDGLKINDPSNVDRQFDAAFLSASFLKTLNVYKGPQSVLLGSDSLGGVVEMETRKGEDAPEARVTFNAGSFGTLEGAVSKDWSNSQGSRGTLSAYRFHSDGISRLNKKRFKASEADSTDISQLTSSSVHQWNPSLQSDLLFSFLRGENELDGATSDNTNDQSTNDQYLVQQKTHYRVSDSTAVSLRNGMNRHQRHLDTLARGEESYGGQILQNEALLRMDRKRFDLLAGLATEHEEFNLEDVQRNFDLHSFFTQGAFQIQKLKLQAGARAEKHVRYGLFYTGSSGLSYSFNDQTYSLQYSQGFKAPSLYQLYAPAFLGSNIGNPSLVPEVNHSWEGSWSMKNAIYEAELGLFQNSLSNLITYTVGNGYINQSRFTAKGAEISGKYKHRFYHVHSSYFLQQFNYQDSPVLRRPQNSINLGVALFPSEKSELSFKGRWFSSRKDLDQNSETIKLNGYETFDLGFKYFFHEADIGLQMINVFNRDYEDLFGYSVMPRSFYLHLGFQL